MIRRRSRTGVALAMAVAFAAGGAGLGCSGDDETAAPPDPEARAEAESSETTETTETTTVADQLAGSYVGTVEGTDEYVAIVVADDGDAMAFVTDGGDRADLLNGFVGGEAEGGAAQLVNDGGAELKIGPTDGAAGGGLASQGVLSGTFTRPGSSPQVYAVGPAEAPAGLYRASQTFADGEYMACWVVLDDGSQKGAIRRYETPLPPGSVETELDLSDPAALVVEVPGGILHPLYVDPDRL